MHRTTLRISRLNVKCLEFLETSTVEQVNNAVAWEKPVEDSVAKKITTIIYITQCTTITPFH